LGIEIFGMQRPESHGVVASNDLVERPATDRSAARTRC
jgi:hypothetical protein